MGTSKRSSTQSEETAKPHPLLHHGRVARAECAEDWEDLAFRSDGSGLLSDRYGNCGEDPVPLDKLFC